MNNKFFSWKPVHYRPNLFFARFCYFDLESFLWSGYLAWAPLAVQNRHDLKASTATGKRHELVPA